MIKYGLLTADDEMASEHEVYDLLYALVRLLKPRVIIETGTYKGGAAKAMARAAKENEIGGVFTCDIDREKILALDGISLDLPVCAYIAEGVDFVTWFKDGVDFAFIDSSGDRVAEIRALNLSPSAVVVLHDSNRPQYQPAWTAHPWRSIWHIATEQGLTIFQL